MNTVSFLTLGCKVNQYDTDAMRGLFVQRGYRVVPIHEPSDVCVINTCSVTHIGERKSRQAIRKAKKMNPDTMIVVTGCYAQLTPETIAEIDGVNIIIGTQDRHKIVDFVESYQPATGPQSYVRDIMATKDFEDLHLYGEALEHTRAYIKIQEGCGNFCTFCIIPFTRGRLKSRPIADIVTETDRLVGLGYKEVVLTGIHLGNYGHDFRDGSDLATVVRELLAKTSVERIRLGSIESVELSEELIELLVHEPRLCPHLHLPLQSGSERVLQMMRRHYHLQDYLELVQGLQKKIPGLALTTDLIVGFPGETEEMFQETLQTLRSIGFAGVHIFPYSKRSGTPAASFPNQVPENVKKERVHRAEQVASETAAQYRRSFIGREVAVLVENRLSNGRYEGMTPHYCRVRLVGENFQPGMIVPVQIVDVEDDVLIGTSK